MTTKDMYRRFEGCTFANGDRATGYFYEEDGRTWYAAIDAKGNEYETNEVPAKRLGITLLRFEGTWTRPQVEAYLLAKE